MPGSNASVLDEAEDLQAALSADGVAGVVVTARGQFRARVTQVRLNSLRLAAVEETQSRIAFISVPADMVLISFPMLGGRSPVWSGIAVRATEMITFGPAECLFTRAIGPCRWGTIRVPGQQLARYGRALKGAAFVVPRAARWRPSPQALRQLRHLHRAGIRLAETSAGALADAQAAHGLEQQLIDALIECLSGEPEKEEVANHRHRGILAQFEHVLVANPFARMADICAALGISERLLRECCNKHLGIGPSRYRRLHGMHQVRRALRSGSDAASVSEVVRRHGFRDLGRFAINYRALYGELPSTTLRRAIRAGVAELTLGRPHMKVL